MRKPVKIRLICMVKKETLIYSQPLCCNFYPQKQDRNGNIWFGTNPVGVCHYDGKSFEWITEEDETEFRDEGANGVRSITEDKNSDFWFNTEKRYSVYDSTTLKSNKFYTRHESIGSLDGKNTIGLNEYLSTVRDNENNLWFLTYRDGVWKYDGTKITHYPIQEKSKQIALFSIYKDNTTGNFGWALTKMAHINLMEQYLRNI
ncbi:hypothetical protein ABS768_05760 [Flavobacterium sp. ST-75]|uniref:Two component regulator propeller n=1 Tax=Flavobacterium rhizophilum TaxID=3163296 RepID=A0ABW8Y9V6_9FLAO